MIKKMILVASIMISFSIALSACGTSNESSKTIPETQDTKDSQSVIETLNNAKSINLKKEVFTIGDVWKVYADEKQVAEIKGESFYLIGDTYSMYSNEGNLVGIETEEFSLTSSQSTTYGYNGEKRGKIKQKLISVGYNFDIYNDEEKIGNSKQKIVFKLKADIKDNNNQIEYNIEKKILSIGSDLTITPNEQIEDKSVNAIDSIWVTVMMNEIAEGQESKNNNS